MNELTVLNADTQKRRRLGGRGEAMAMVVSLAVLMVAPPASACREHAAPLADGPESAWGGDSISVHSDYASRSGEADDCNRQHQRAGRAGRGALWSSAEEAEVGHGVTGEPALYNCWDEPMACEVSSPVTEALAITTWLGEKVKELGSSLCARNEKSLLPGCSSALSGLQLAKHSPPRNIR
jgi:hypothetical protein